MSSTNIIFGTGSVDSLIMDTLTRVARSLDMEAHFITRSLHGNCVAERLLSWLDAEAQEQVYTHGDRFERLARSRQTTWTIEVAIAAVFVVACATYKMGAEEDCAIVAMVKRTRRDSTGHVHDAILAIAHRMETILASG